MKVYPESISDILVFEPDVHGDHRGFFMETWRREWFSERGLDFEFVQENHSRSIKGTLRGLHYQIIQPQGKFLRVVAGEIFDVAVDIRQKSPTFGQWVGITLSSENKKALWIPPGFAHGFCVLSDAAEMVYKCTDYYAPEHERSLLWNDLALGINWPLTGEEVIISEKDKHASPLSDSDLYP